MGDHGTKPNRHADVGLSTWFAASGKRGDGAGQKKRITCHGDKEPRATVRPATATYRTAGTRTASSLDIAAFRI